MSDGEKNGPQKGVRLQKAVAELRDASKLFPIATSMIEGLQGAKDAAVEEMVGDNNALRAKLAGLNKMAAEIEINSKSAKADAERVATAESELQTIARSLDEKATGAEASAAKAAASAEEVHAAISTLNIKVGEKVYSGSQALAVLASLVTQIPARVKSEVERVVSAEVTTDDGKKEAMSGTALVSHIVSELDYVKRAAGAAVSDAEHVNELLTEGGRMVVESNDSAMKAEQEAGKASAAAEESKGLVEGLQAELASTRKKLDIAFGVIMTLFDKNGLNTEVTETEMADIEAEASKVGEDNE